LGDKKLECETRVFETKEDMIVASLKANVGGSLPPKPENLTHTMSLLFASGVFRKRIIAMVSDQTGFPPRLVQKHIKDVQTVIAHRRIRNALNAVVKAGKTVDEAAAEQGVKVELLKKKLEGKVNNKAGAPDIDHAKAFAAKKFQGLNHSVGHLYSRLSRDLTDGLINNEDIESVLVYIDGLLERARIIHSSWVKRLNAKNLLKDKLAKVDDASLVEQKSVGSKVLSRMGLE
jgi:hypothetical protein